jgi:hypothetical protein
VRMFFCAPEEDDGNPADESAEAPEDAGDKSMPVRNRKLLVVATLDRLIPTEIGQVFVDLIAKVRRVIFDPKIIDFNTTSS